MEERSRWEVFQGKPNRIHGGGARITLNPRKVFLINNEAYKALGEPAAVEFRYDENTRTIGLAPRDIRNQNAFPLADKTTNRKYKYRTIQGAPFCKHFNIKPETTILFIDIDLDNEGTILLELSTAVKVGRGFR